MSLLMSIETTPERRQEIMSSIASSLSLSFSLAVVSGIQAAKAISLGDIELHLLVWLTSLLMNCVRPLHTPLDIDKHIQV